MKEATLRDFFAGSVSADTVAIEVRGAVERLSGNRRRVHVQDLPAGEEVTVTPQMLVQLCDAVLADALPASALETIAFTILVSEHLHCTEGDELVTRVLYDWATPEINWKLTARNVRMFRDWLTGQVAAPRGARRHDGVARRDGIAPKDLQGAGMKSKLLATAARQRTFALVFDTGDEVMAGLQAFAREQQLAGSHFTGIGGCRAVTLGYFEWDTKQYRPIPVEEQVEVLSLVGDVSLAPDGQRKVHAHIVVGKADGTAHGGHLLRGTVRPTLEVILTESPGYLQRQEDPDAGIPLIRL